MTTVAPPVERLQVNACTVPTEEVESDATLIWDSTTCVVVQSHARGAVGVGYSYTHATAADLIEDVLAEIVIGADANAVTRVWQDMVSAVRNLGNAGLAAAAVSAVDVSLWDLKARLQGLALVDLLGQMRDEVPIYASGGFTSYSTERLADMAAGWLEEGHRRGKIKIGRRPHEDPRRLAAVREAVGPDFDLYVDANGAFDVGGAVAVANEMAPFRVSWFEEPVSSDDLLGLAEVRRRIPPGMEVTAGEYGHDPHYFARMLSARSVDVIMPDATRCGGVTGFLRVAAVADAVHIPVSAHTAPSLHLHAAAAVPRLRHIEWFHDHVLVERRLFDGTPQPRNGTLVPDHSRPGNGLEVVASAVRRFAA